MDLVVETRCYFCDKIFCCPQHRRSHELLAHPKRSKKMMEIPLARKKSDSYALGMRKFLYTEQNRLNCHSSRKRNYVTISKIVQEEEKMELKFSNRKILIPHRKKTEIHELPKLNAIDKVDKDEEDKDEEKTISPIHDMNKIFTTSTPILKRTKFMSFSPKAVNQQIPVPLESIIEAVADIPEILSSVQTESVRVERYQKRKVTFSESIESVYETVSESVPPENKPGIFTSVANAFHAAFQRIPGVGEVTEEHFATPYSPGGSRRKPTRELSRGQFIITGRRPLHQKYKPYNKILSPEN